MSFFQKLKAGLSKTKEGMLKNLDSLFGGHKIEEEFYEELEENPDYERRRRGGQR